MASCLLALLLLAPPADVAAALDRIGAERLREHVEFLASDLLEGRDTPSRGLNSAALYLAAAFEEIGLAPPCAGSFFQEVRWNQGEYDPAGSELRIEAEGGVTLVIPGSAFTARLGRLLEPLRELPVAAVAAEEDDPGRALRGSVALVTDGDPARVRRAAAAGAAAVITRAGADLPGRVRTPVVSLAAGHLAPIEALQAAQDAPLRATLTLSSTSSAPVRNVCGLLPGSAQADEVVLVTAHYDHIGRGKPKDGDAICNGADDNASGTAAVVEIARSLAAVGRAPRRSVLFVAFFGEERGLVGSSYYARQPLFPPSSTVCMVNLEMLGRPDDIQPGEAWITGYPLSTFGEIVAAAGAEVGVRFYEREPLSARLFRASDNAALAAVGVPAHSISAGSLHADYHQPSDHAEKLDYGNMEAVVRGVAYATWVLADGENEPAWTAAGESQGYGRVE